MDENGKEVKKEFIPNPKAEDDDKTKKRGDDEKKKEEEKKEVVEEEPIVELDTTNMEEFK